MIKKKAVKLCPLKQDMDKLDDLIQACYEKLKNGLKTRATLGDFLKMVEMRMKLAPSESEQAEFWKMLDKVRLETLEKKEPAASSSSKTKRTSAPRKKK